jgi:hypothetical protein
VDLLYAPPVNRLGTFLQVLAENIERHDTLKELCIYMSKLCDGVYCYSESRRVEDWTVPWGRQEDAVGSVVVFEDHEEKFVPLHGGDVS